MIPKLTDDAISMLPLESGRAELLEEIMTTVAPDRQTEPTPNPTPRRNPLAGARWPPPRSSPVSRAGPLWWQQQRPEQDDSSRVAAARPPRGPGRGAGRPGLEGRLARRRRDHSSATGDANLEITSYAAKDYDSYVEDREHIVDPPAPGAPVTVLGRPGQLWAYSPDDHTVIREVEDGHWMEFRGQGMDQDAYLALLGQLRLTSDAEFDAALPDDYVTKDERDIAAEQILGEIRNASNAGFPGGSSLQLGAGESKDYYQFGAEVVAQYACAWLEDFENAKAHGQQARADEAARVLGTSRQWPILKQMNADGDYSEVVWELADQAVAGQVPDWYREGLGC